MRYFELFDLPINFQVDIPLLTQRYRDIQKKVHPDNFANASDRERLLAVQQSSEVNDAFDTLKSPLTRAEYMVKEHGFDVKNEQMTIKDGMFLMQQMELREELEDIAEATDIESAFDDFYDDVKELILQYTEQFETQFNLNDYENAAVAVRKLRFMYKLKSEAQQLEEKLLDE